VVSPSQKRRAIKHAVEQGKGTTAEACRAVGLQRSTYYRNSMVNEERQKIERTIVDLSEDHPRYNTERPHSALEDKTPEEFANRGPECSCLRSGSALPSSRTFSRKIKINHAAGFQL